MSILGNRVPLEFIAHWTTTPPSEIKHLEIDLYPDARAQVRVGRWHEATLVTLLRMPSDDYGRALCKHLGLNHNNVARLRLVLELDKPVGAEALLWVDEELLELPLPKVAPEESNA